MTGPAIAAVISRELKTLERELNAYPTEAQIWEVPAPLPNSAGTLVLHLVGNLQHFVGTGLGGSSFVRDRDAEFSRRNVPRADLIADLQSADRTVRETLPSMEAGRFAEAYPLAVANRRVNTGEFMMHLVTHLAYHVGQLDYHRRIVTGDATGVGAVSPLELPRAAPIEA